MRGAWMLAVGIVGCSGPDEPHACDDGVPTCDSSLVISLPDPRTDFRIRVSDELGLDLDISCPIPEGGTEQFGDYSVICGSGRLAIDTFDRFGDVLEVQLEEGAVRTIEPTYQKGGDYCGNPCTTGTVQL
jgi:hypothetical protein